MIDGVTIPPVVPHGMDEVYAYFGDPKFSGAPDTHVDIAWERANLTLVDDLPCGVGRLYMHRKIVEPTRRALARSEAETAWRPRRVGCFQPRLIRGATVAISMHTLAVAEDYDPDDNPMVICDGRDGRPLGNPLALYLPGDARRIDPGPRTVTDDVVRIFKGEGFFWGGAFHGRYDPMHFQYATGC